jgi:hypothetical protein
MTARLITLFRLTLQTLFHSETEMMRCVVHLSEHVIPFVNVLVKACHGSCVSLLIFKRVACVSTFSFIYLTLPCSLN